MQVSVAKAAPKKLESDTLTVKVKGHIWQMCQINLCGKMTGSTKAIKHVYDTVLSCEGSFVLRVNETSDLLGGVVTHVFDWNLIK